MLHHEESPEKPQYNMATLPPPPFCLTSLCITASGNILASGNLGFKVFKLQLKVINKFLFTYTVYE